MYCYHEFSDNFRTRRVERRKIHSFCHTYPVYFGSKVLGDEKYKYSACNSGPMQNIYLHTRK